MMFAAMTDPGFAEPLFSLEDSKALFDAYWPWAQTVWTWALGLWVMMAAFQLLYVGFQVYFADRSVWPGLAYPIVSALFLATYPMWASMVLSAPIKIADQLGPYSAGGESVPAGVGAEYQIVRKDEAESWSVLAWAKEKVDGAANAVADLTEALPMRLLMIVTLMFSSVVYSFLQVLQAVAAGILIVLGGAFLALAAFQPTAKFATRWITFYIEVSLWPLIWKLCLVGVVVMNGKLKGHDLTLSFTDTDTAVATMQKLVAMVVSGLLTISVPFLAGKLMGGSFGSIVAGTGMVMASKAATAAGQTVGGAVSGGMAGGVGGAAMGALTGMASAAGIRGIESPGMAAAKQDAVASRRDPGAAAKQADAVQAKRDPAAAASHSDAVQANRDPKGAADWQAAVRNERIKGE